MSEKVKIYHLYHSGVAVETENNLLVFDYYRDSPTGTQRSLTNGVVSAADFSGKSGYVFVSHSHGDHYQPVIYDWKEENSDLKYILSDDVNGKHGQDYYYVKKDEQLIVDDISMQTYGSTDKGVSFLVNLDNINIFHAGDLNWWHWQSFSEDELKKEERDYKNEVEKLKDEKLNIAFIPVDPRLEQYYYLAGEHFIKQIKPDMLIPIHFANKYEITDEFANKMSGYDVEVVRVNHRGQKIYYKPEPEK